MEQGQKNQTAIERLLDIANEFYDSENIEEKAKCLLLYQNIIMLDPENAFALNRIGNCYSYGIGVSIDKEKAKEYYFTAASLGNISAQYNYANQLYRENNNDCIEWFEKASINGDSDALDMLGDIYRDGILAEKNIDLAVSYFNEAIDAGNQYAMLDLGVLFLEGEEIPKDTLKGIELMKKAYEQKNPDAAVNLSKVYIRGDGVEQNVDLAIEWAMKALELGDNNQLASIAHNYYEGSKGLEKNNSKALELFLIAAEAKHAESCYNCGIFYLNGYGTEKNDDLACKWFVKAAELNKEDSIDRIEEIYKEKYQNEFDDKFFELMEKLAVMGNGEALCRIHFNYRDGIATEINLEKAMHYLKASIEKEFTSAYILMGAYHLDGLYGVKKDFEKAIYYLEKATEKGSSNAANRLASIYYSEKYTEKNIEKVIHWKKVAYENGDYDACTYLGALYQKENEGVLDYEKSLFYLNIAYEEGSPVAAMFLANLYNEGNGIDKDEEKAFTLYKFAAENGVDASYLALGMCYLNGTGTERNVDFAKCWFEKAKENGIEDADKYINYVNKILNSGNLEVLPFEELKVLADEGNADAQFTVYRAYLKGENVEKDADKAVIYLKKAAENNHPVALGIFAEFILGDGNINDAISYLERSANLGNLYAKYKLGVLLLDGFNSGPIDKIKGFNFINEAAESGLTEAENQLGVCYMLGNGAERNEEIAVEWFRKAAEKGYAPAQKNLGIAYADGEGVAQSNQKAIEWLEKASEQGLMYAKLKLADIYAEDNDVLPNYEKAASLYIEVIKSQDQELVGKALINIAYMYSVTLGDDNRAFPFYSQAAQQGNVIAQYNLGLMYHNGRGTPQNDNMAIYWWRKAAEQGDEDAKNNLDILLTQIYGENYKSFLNESADKIYKNKEVPQEEKEIVKEKVQDTRQENIINLEKQPTEKEKNVRYETEGSQISYKTILFALIAIVLILAIVFTPKNGARNEEQENELNNVPVYSQDDNTKIETEKNEWTILSSKSEIEAFELCVPDVDPGNIAPILKYTWSNQNVLTLAFDSVYMYQMFFKGLDTETIIDNSGLYFDTIALEDVAYGTFGTMGYYLPSYEVEDQMEKNAKNIFGIDKYVLRKSPFYEAGSDSYVYNIGLGGASDDVFIIEKIVLFNEYAFVYQRLLDGINNERGCITMMKQDVNGNYYYLSNFSVKNINNVLKNTFEKTYSVKTPAEINEEKIYYVTAGSGLRVRTGPGINDDNILTIPYDAPVLCLGEENGWVYIKYANIYGWMSKEYLRQ